jgi:phospholipase C
MPANNRSQNTSLFNVIEQNPSRASSNIAELNRRDFIRGVLGALAGVMVGDVALAQEAAAGALPNPSTSGLDHIILVMMENRSMDHFLGWYKAADGRQAGLTYLDANGQPHSTFHLRDFQGCSHPDPDHSYAGGRVEYDGGLCDGWLRAGSNDIYSIGYYKPADLAFLGKAVPRWSTFSRYFAAMMAETFPNRIYQHAAQTDRLTNTNTISTLPTIWDLLLAQGVSATYYFSDVPFLALWGLKYLPISRPITQFFADAKAGTLPAVSFIDPHFLGEAQGISDDDHPHADIRKGEVFLNQIYSAVTSSPAWPKTALIINFDEWGGFFDHVPPPTAPIPPASAAAGDTDGRLGFRVPCLIVSPFARRAHVSGDQFDHCSVLKLIEWRWSLPNLTVRDSVATNLANTMNFSFPNLRAPQFEVPQGIFGLPCPSTAARTASGKNEWTQLRSLAAAQGWPVR